MANDPRDLDGRKLQKALLTLGRDKKLRGELIGWLKSVEGQVCYGAAVRDDITGPIIDALHTEEDLYEKTLADGTRFQFLYRTKIARDFLLAQQEHPSHVWEPQTTRLLKHLAARTAGDVLIGGAYFGDHAVLLGRQLMGTGRQVHCFEPNTAQIGMLEKNARINQLNNLIPHRKGLWNESSLRLRLDGFDSFANAVLADRSEVGFETISVDDYCAVIGRNLGVVMLDIEGAELFALQGAVNTIAKDKPAIVFELHRDYVDWSDGLINTPIVALLVKAGYQVFAVRDFNGNQEMQQCCIELVPADTVYLEGPPHGFNMLAVPNESLIDGSLFRQVRNVSPKLLRHKDPALHHPLDGLPD
jgi:FkbM family methyltransferase